MQLIDLARQMVNAGAAGLLIEGAATEVSQIITERTEIPVISCGSGPACDGQVLVAPDILGLTDGKLPKFSKAYAELGPRSIEAFRTYAEEVKARRFPHDEHSYHKKPGDLQRLTDLLGPHRTTARALPV
jgi:3-methyl-2-oxobutanoate hydroxymethyltransferase